MALDKLNKINRQIQDMNTKKKYLLMMHEYLSRRRKELDPKETDNQLDRHLLYAPTSIRSTLKERVFEVLNEQLEGIYRIAEMRMAVDIQSIDYVIEQNRQIIEASIVKPPKSTSVDSEQIKNEQI